MKCELLNQLKEANASILIGFDEKLNTPPYVKRPIRFWLDTPNGRIQMTAGECLDMSFEKDSGVFVALNNVKFQHDAYEEPNDFINKIMASFDITNDSKIDTLLTSIGVSEIQLEVFKDQSEMMPVQPKTIWCSINGKHLPLNSGFYFSAPKRG